IINKRVKTVLNKMKELGRVSEEEYNNAISEVDAGIKFTKGEVSQNNKLSYYLEAARDQVLNELMEKNNYSRDEAKLELYGKGYQIYTNLDQSIQAEVDKEFIDNAKKWSITIKANRTNKETGEKYKEEVQRQGAMVVINNETGYVVAGSGGFGEKKVAEGINRMTIKGHSPGSCMKPIGIIGPSLEEGKITAATTVDDIPTSFGTYAPKNWYDHGGNKGYMNIRELLQTSANVPEVILLQKLTVPKSLSYLEKMGVDVSAEKDVGLSLALGGMTNGMTPLELATCYGTVANGGVYRTPLFYTKVVDQNGRTVLEAKQESTRVFSEQNAWILQDLLKEPIYNGITGGGNAKVAGHETRGKTGTTNNNSSASFAGFTKLYTASVCMFFDIEADGNQNTNANSTQCAILWGNVMRPVHKGLEAKTWNRPSGITTAVVCKTSGQLATEECQHDPEGNKAYTEYFSQGNIPASYCTVHKTVEVCTKTNKLASSKCTEKVSRVFITRENADTDTRWKSAADAKYMAPTETCTECAEQAPIDDVTDPNGNGNSVVNNMINVTNKTNTTNTTNTTNKVTNTTNTANNVTNTAGN
ncbi:MAG: penicillin-binding protein, partial [Clostridia bacterium]|nr:penicillin-binding protein [Clostridia bacterium]